MLWINAVESGKIYRYHGYESARVLWINGLESGESIDQAEDTKDNLPELQKRHLSIGWEIYRYFGYGYEGVLCINMQEEEKSMDILELGLGEYSV